MSGSSGDGNGSMVSSGEEPIEGSTMLQLYYIYCIAIGCLLLLGLIVLILLLIIKQRRCKKDKIRDECDEYEDVFDQTILELFETLDTRNRSPQNKSPLSVETNFGSSVSDSTNNHVHLTKTIVSLESCQLKSPNSINKSSSFNATRSAVDMSLLKPLGHKKETFTSADSVYDKLSDSSDSSQDITQLEEENTYKNVKAALSPRVSPNHQTEHIYDDTVKSLLEKNKRKHMKGRKNLITPTIPLTTLSQDEGLYTIPALFKNDNEDIEGYYIIPDNFPPSKYAYSSARELVSSPDSNMGEVRCQNEHKPISKNERGQTCTATDGVITGGNALNSLTCDFKEHRNTAQTRIECNDTDKPNGRDCNPNHSQAKKSSSIPMNTSETMRGLHTYANVSQFTKTLNSSNLPQEELQNGSVNPLYSTCNSLINKKDDSSPAFRNHFNILKEKKAKTLGHTSSGAVATDGDQDYLSSTNEWLEQVRKQARLKNSLKTTVPQQLETCSAQDTDHIYMGILVRERESHDYSSPKRMVSFSSSSKIRTMPEGIRMTRTLSLDNPNCILNDSKYENQAMWLPSPSNGAAKTVGGFHRQTSSSGYMDLSSTGYETHYTNLKFSGNSQQ